MPLCLVSSRLRDVFFFCFEGGNWFFVAMHDEETAGKAWFLVEGSSHLSCIKAATAGLFLFSF